MAREIDRHQHKTAASRPRPFPVGEEETSEYVRALQEYRAGDVSPKRASKRFEVDAQRVVVTLLHPGGSLTATESALIDLSAGGGGFLYPGFVHQGSSCVVHMKTFDGETEQVAGETVWCRFMGRSVHAIGVRWLEPIDIKRFVGSRRWLEHVATSDEAHSAPLEGTVLTLGFDAMETDLLRVHVEDERLRIVEMDRQGAALDFLKREGADSILLDADNPEIDPQEFHRKLREGGLQEPVAFVTSRADHIEQWCDESVGHVLSRPFTGEVLTGLLRDQLLNSSNPMAGTRPIVSTLPETKRRAVETYIGRLRLSSEQLEDCVTRDNYEVALRVVQTIQNTASGYGFPIVEACATDAIKAINASCSAAESRNEITQLIKLVNRLKAA